MIDPTTRITEILTRELPGIGPAAETTAQIIIQELGLNKEEWAGNDTEHLLYRYVTDWKFDQQL